MNTINKISDRERYARCIQASKRVRWDVDEDVIRGRRFDAAHKFLPDGLSLAAAFTTLSANEKRFVSQIQGRTYANIFGLVERFINAKVLELSHDHWFGDQVALEALVRFSDEELKHQALFRLVDAMVGDVLPAGYRFDVDHNAVAHAVLGKSTWAVLALTLDIELFTQLTRASTPTPSSPNCSRTCSSSWSPRWTAFCKHRPKPTPATSRQSAAARSTRRRRGRSRRRSSRPTAGNTSTQAPSTRTSGRCCPA